MNAVKLRRYHSSSSKHPPRMTDELPSKTQRKREMHELQALGAELVELNDEQLASMDLPERLHGRRAGRTPHVQTRGAAPPDAVHRQDHANRGRRADSRAARRVEGRLDARIPRVFT